MTKFTGDENIWLLQVTKCWCQDIIFIWSEQVCQDFPSPERWQAVWRCGWSCLMRLAVLLLLGFLSLRSNHQGSGLEAGSSRFLSNWLSRSWWSPPSWPLSSWPCPHWPRWRVSLPSPAGLLPPDIPPRDGNWSLWVQLNSNGLGTWTLRLNGSVGRTFPPPGLEESVNPLKYL